MFTVTDEAKQELEGFFSDKEKASVRVYLTAGGCSGPRLALALDQALDSDSIFDEKGFKFCMDTELYAKAQDITIDSGYMGFIVQSTVPLAQEGGGCSCCSGGCGS
ncbi:MAG: IscA/HesB family protein [Deltaproteobacteria bacterium]|jgi:Fe-S cluster assembly iron-binding protein IscA|nr:IscA/HesB family protein [Deltaproteobacteria bacterium]